MTYSEAGDFQTFKRRDGVRTSVNNKPQLVADYNSWRSRSKYAAFKKAQGKAIILAQLAAEALKRYTTGDTLAILAEIAWVIRKEQSKSICFRLCPECDKNKSIKDSIIARLA